jgi:hypothetical protein
MTIPCPRSLNREPQWRREPDPPDFVRLTLPRSAVERIRSLADERDTAHWCLPYKEWLRDRLLSACAGGSAVLINSASNGWWIVDQGGGGRLFAEPEQALALCRELASGNARDRDIAARIREQSDRFNVDTTSWPGERAQRKPSKPRGRRDVAKAWLRGEALNGGHMRTDGKTVWSWWTVIGKTVRGRKVVLDCGKISRSTSAHVGALRRVASATRKPRNHR